jgi:hypothetical protein
MKSLVGCGDWQGVVGETVGVMNRLLLIAARRVENPSV